MTVPGLTEWVFSAKTFAAALIALYIALSLGLDRPYWCVATVYIVSQPLAGAMRSKAVYRICGTLLGATAAVALVPNLVDAPVLLVTALCLWLGVCLYFALGDRSPRSYVFLLAGYTAAIIGFPSVDQPGQIFDTAVARVEEIGLGILCATMAVSLVFPRSAAPVLDARLGAYFAVARRSTPAASRAAAGHRTRRHAEPRSGNGAAFRFRGDADDRSHLRLLDRDRMAGGRRRRDDGGNHVQLLRNAGQLGAADPRLSQGHRRQYRGGRRLSVRRPASGDGFRHPRPGPRPALPAPRSLRGRCAQ